MIISYDFPTCFLSYNKEMPFCSAQRYLLDKEYREYFQKEKNVILGDKTATLFSNLSEEDYAKVIYQLNPSYYFLPYSENVEKQIDFYRKGFTSIPIATSTGKNIMEVFKCIEQLDEDLPAEALISIPYNLEMLKNKQKDIGYFTEKDISFEPLRMAVNRKLLLKDIASTMKKFNRKVCLFGCYTLTEFDNWGSNFDKTFISNLITSHPVIMTLEGPCNHYRWGFFVDNNKMMPMKHYCPQKYIEFYTGIDPEEVSIDQLEENIEYFTDIAQRWINDN